MREITLRQVEVIRAVMLRGTISGAAEHLNVSAPGVSRLIKHTEESLGCCQTNDNSHRIAGAA